MKTKRHLLTLIIMATLINAGNSQDNSKPWNNKKCAIVLTYDDGLNVHLDNVIPALDTFGLKATFYIPGNAETLYKRQNEWKIVAENGHELGNHTLFHPCAGKSKGRAWVSDDYDLDNYSLTQIVDEIKVANTMLMAIDGKTERTFAYTCGDMQVGDSSFVDSIRGEFAGARGVAPKVMNKDSIDVFNINCHSMSNKTGNELIDIVKQAEAANGLVVFLFHGVGGEHSINVDLVAHNELIRYLAVNKNQVWVVPLLEIVNYIGNNK